MKIPLQFLHFLWRKIKISWDFSFYLPSAAVLLLLLCVNNPTCGIENLRVSCNWSKRSENNKNTITIIENWDRTFMFASVFHYSCLFIAPSTSAASRRNEEGSERCYGKDLLQLTKDERQTMMKGDVLPLNQTIVSNFLESKARDVADVTNRRTILCFVLSFESFFVQPLHVFGLQKQRIVPRHMSLSCSIAFVGWKALAREIKTFHFISMKRAASRKMKDEKKNRAQRWMTWTSNWVILYECNAAVESIHVSQTTWKNRKMSRERLEMSLRWRFDLCWRWGKGSRAVHEHELNPIVHFVWR